MRSTTKKIATLANQLGQLELDAAVFQEKVDGEVQHDEGQRYTRCSSKSCCLEAVLSTTKKIATLANQLGQLELDAPSFQEKVDGEVQHDEAPR